MGDAAIERRRLRKETRRLTIEKNASGVMLQTLKTSKDSKVAAEIPASDIEWFIL